MYFHNKPSYSLDGYLPTPACTFYESLSHLLTHRAMPRLPFLLFLLLIVVLPGCGVFNADDREVSARVFGDDVYVSNNTEARIYYVIVGRETEKLIDLRFHLDVEQSVTPGKTARLDREDDILGSADEKEAVVFWWHAVERDGARVPGQGGSFVFKL